MKKTFENWKDALDNRKPNHGSIELEALESWLYLTFAWFAIDLLVFTVEDFNMSLQRVGILFLIYLAW